MRGTMRRDAMRRDSASGARPGRRPLGLAVGALALGTLLAAGGAGAQQRDTTRADSTRADSARADTTRADTAHADTTRGRPRPATAASPVPADSESVFARLGLDRLRLRGVGVVIGAVKPSQMEGTEAFGIEADYGEILPGWRVVFTPTFWVTHLNDATMARYRDQLRSVVIDPTGDAEVDVGRVRVTDISLGADVRWSPRGTRSAFLRPYLGGGVSAHVLNAEGRAIHNTFVERALDNIAVGPVLMAGGDAVFFRHVTLGMQARYDLVNAARHGSVRALATYLFDPARRAPRGTNGGGR
ncbi:MAG: hypothetical protein ACJ79S_18255 [Gemmatimonadaceae bacterium]